ncbi:hypothetical protein HT574_16585 [Parageobacillus sp. VR-IP]|uniref:hypothetical protein n=1 Tax=Parageobacillus sp. VR-IP TaxID=2742205 RepID=UPI0015834CEB|nr:hypothetical protein [Parageobacillus sp. VR-IP]NUK31635.1 hypothetical protein [Parageobacillus sp. VR-IP]
MLLTKSIDAGIEWKGKAIAFFYAEASSMEMARNSLLSKNVGGIGSSHSILS